MEQPNTKELLLGYFMANEELKVHRAKCHACADHGACFHGRTLKGLFESWRGELLRKKSIDLAKG